MPDATAEQSAPAGGRSPARYVIWLIALAVLAGAYFLGVFDQAPGPDPGEVEQAIVDNAADYGVAATVACPDDSDQVAEGASFDCTVTVGKQTFPIRVTNRGDTFSWDSSQLATVP